jgi:hypothetical protein
VRMCIFADLARLKGVPSELFIDSACIKVHRTSCGARGGPWLRVLASPKAAGTPSSTTTATRRGVSTPFC